MDPRADITGLLGEIGRGNKDAMNRLLPLVYDELRHLARAHFRRERGDHTLQPTALVHEAYLRLADQRTPMESRSHFLALAATQMRRILLDYARRHRRRGGSGERVTVEDTIALCQPPMIDLIALDKALSKLAQLDTSQAQVVELRFFGGLSLDETAQAMGLSTATLKRSWNSARAFLRHEIEGGANRPLKDGRSSTDD